MLKNKKEIFIKVNPTINIKNDPWSDQDGDYWPNWKDCKPKDPKRQHVRPSQTTKERLEKLPIFFVSGDSDTPKKRAYGVDKTIYTKEGKKKVKKVPKDVKKAQQRFYSVIKRRPDVIGEIERKKPAIVIISARGGEKQKGQARGTDEMSIEDKKEGQHRVEINLSAERGRPYRYGDVEEGAGTFVHELEHVRQFRAWEGKPKLQKRMEKGRHDNRKEEILAYKAEEKAHKKRYTWPSVKRFKEGVAKTQERFDEIEEEE